MNAETMATIYWRNARTLDTAEPLLAEIARNTLAALADKPGRIGAMAARKVALFDQRRSAA